MRTAIAEIQARSREEFSWEIRCRSASPAAAEAAGNGVIEQCCSAFTMQGILEEGGAQHLMNQF